MMTTKGKLWLRAGALALWSWAVLSGWLAAFDQAAAESLAGLHTPALDTAARWITFFGSSAVAVAAVLVLSVLEWRRRGTRSAALWIGAFAAGVALEAALRLGVGQWRPNTLAMPPSATWHERFELLGFPSGHAFRAALLSGWVGCLWPSLRSASLALSVLVAVTRPYLNRHWASDVVGGWLVAWLMLALIDALKERYQGST